MRLVVAAIIVFLLIGCLPPNPSISFEIDTVLQGEEESRAHIVDILVQKHMDINFVPVPDCPKELSIEGSPALWCDLGKVVISEGYINDAPNDISIKINFHREPRMFEIIILESYPPRQKTRKLSDTAKKLAYDIIDHMKEFYGEENVTNIQEFEP